MGVILGSRQGRMAQDPTSHKNRGRGFYSTLNRQPQAALNREQKDLSFQKVTLALVRGMDRELGSGLEAGGLVTWLLGWSRCKRLRPGARSRD